MPQQFSCLIHEKLIIRDLKPTLNVQTDFIWKKLIDLITKQMSVINTYIILIHLCLTGPPFTHLSPPERSLFFGDVSPKDRPEFYVKCIHNVYQTYADKYRNKIPLIVNTQGWVKGE